MYVTNTIEGQRQIEFAVEASFFYEPESLQRCHAHTTFNVFAPLTAPITSFRHY